MTICLVLASINQGLLNQNTAEAMTHENEWSLLPVVAVATDGLQELICFVRESRLATTINGRGVIYVERYSCARDFLWEIVSGPKSAILGPCIQRMLFVVFTFGIQAVNQDNTTNKIC